MNSVASTSEARLARARPLESKGARSAEETAGGKVPLSRSQPRGRRESRTCPAALLSHEIGARAKLGSGPRESSSFSSSSLFACLKEESRGLRSSSRKSVSASRGARSESGACGSSTRSQGDADVSHGSAVATCEKSSAEDCSAPWNAPWMALEGGRQRAVLMWKHPDVVAESEIGLDAEAGPPVEDEF